MAGVDGALEAGTGTDTSLADADEFATVVSHLTRAEPGEAHERRPLRTNHRPLVHLAVTECRYPDIAQPVRRVRDIITPQNIAGRDQYIEPDDLTRNEQYRSPTAAATHNLNRADRCIINYLRPLRRPEHQRRRRHLINPHASRHRLRHRAPMERSRGPSRSFNSPGQRWSTVRCHDRHHDRYDTRSAPEGT